MLFTRYKCLDVCLKCSGRPLWVLAIAATQPDVHVALRPEVKYVANIHGNEVSDDWSETDRLRCYLVRDWTRTDRLPCYLVGYWTRTDGLPCYLVDDWTRTDRLEMLPCR